MSWEAAAACPRRSGLPAASTHDPLLPAADASWETQPGERRTPVLPTPARAALAFSRHALPPGAQGELSGARGDNGAQGSSTKPSPGMGFAAGGGGDSPATGATARGCRLAGSSPKFHRHPRGRAPKVQISL